MENSDYVTIATEKIPGYEYFSDAVGLAGGIYAGHSLHHYLHHSNIGLSIFGEGGGHYLGHLVASVPAAYVAEKLGDALQSGQLETKEQGGKVQIEGKPAYGSKNIFSRGVRKAVTDFVMGGYIHIPLTETLFGRGYDIDFYTRNGTFNIISSNRNDSDVDKIYSKSIEAMKESDYWTNELVDALSQDKVDLSFQDKTLGMNQFGLLAYGVNEEGESHYKIDISQKLPEKYAQILTMRFLDEVYAIEHNDDRKSGVLSNLRAIKAIGDNKIAGEFIGTLPTESSDELLSILKYEHKTGKDFIEEHSAGNIEFEDLEHHYIGNTIGHSLRFVWDKIRGKERDIYEEASASRFRYDVQKAFGLGTLSVAVTMGMETGIPLALPAAEKFLGEYVPHLLEYLPKGIPHH